MSDTAGDLVMRRHHLPHWQQVGSTYFVTFRSRRGALPDLALDAVRACVLHDHGKRYDLAAGMAMPDHIHLLIRPRMRDAASWYDLGEIMQGIKGTSARMINRVLGTAGSVWQRESFDRIVRDEVEFREKWAYIADNPVKRGLASATGEYRWYIRPPE